MYFRTIRKNIPLTRVPALAFAPALAHRYTLKKRGHEIPRGREAAPQYFIAAARSRAK